jgi:hypothetical protein
MAITSKEGPEPGYITVCLIIHKTTSELERAILTTMYLVGAKNTDRYRSHAGDTVSHPIFRPKLKAFLYVCQDQVSHIKRQIME